MHPRAAIRFPQLNLKRNPFGELSPNERSRLAVCDVAGALKWQRDATDHRRVLQFIGPCGHGKSSHLLACHGNIPGSVLLRIPPSRPWPGVPENVPLLVDEPDRAPRHLWRKILTNEHLIAIGVHRDLTAKFRRRGVEVRTINVSLCGDAHELVKILCRRADAARADLEKPTIEITVEQAEHLLKRYGNDIRAIEDFLYLQVQKLGDSGGVEMRLDV